MDRFILRNFDVNHTLTVTCVDMNRLFVSGKIYTEDGSPIGVTTPAGEKIVIDQGTRISQEVFGKAETVAWNMLQQSWVNWNTPGYRAIPNTVRITMDLIGHIREIEEVQS